MSNLENEVRSLTIQLDETSTKLGEALSKESALLKEVNSLELHVRQQKGSNDKLERQIHNKNCELNVKHEQIKKLERDVSCRKQI